MSRRHETAIPCASDPFLDPFERFELDPGCVLAGVDEVGRGALAGPVSAAAVVLARHGSIAGLADSKTLSPKRREAVAASIWEKAAAVAVAHVEPSMIDALGIAEATRQAMLAALSRLPIEPTLVLVDGLPVDLCRETRAVVRGDSLLAVIAAASIVAKVERDRLMVELDAQFPGYGFARHKGYGTPEHIAAIRQLGPCPAHRMSFAPCATLTLF